MFDFISNRETASNPRVLVPLYAYSENRKFVTSIRKNSGDWIYGVGTCINISEI